MLKRIVLTVFIIVFAFVGCSVEKNSENTKKDIYTIKEYNDTVIVYKNGKPIMKTDIVISSLPRLEALKIKKGISAENFKEVVSIIEMYES